LPVKPTKCSVYVKLESVMVDVSVALVQLGFGQVAFFSKSAAVGTGEELSGGTSSLPFSGERLPVVVGAVCTVDLTGTVLPPLLVHVTVAVYDVTNDPVAFALPTPASSYELHVTNPVVELTEHVAVPRWKCVPVGAAAGLIVVVMAAEAAEADKATSIMAIAATSASRFNWSSSLDGLSQIARTRLTVTRLS
jgi:hypothetical protein